MNYKRTLTPLRYPGGKSKFSPFMVDIIEANGLFGGHYMEPYAGGAGVAINLLLNGVVSHIHINDVDPAINKFWRSVIDDTDTLLRLLDQTPINMDQWYYWQNDLPASLNYVLDVTPLHLAHFHYFQFQVMCHYC